MKKKLLMLSVVFVLTVLFVCVFTVNASAASDECPNNPTGTSHFAGAAADCENACVCVLCNEVLTPALGHSPGSPATCGAPQTCTTCKKVVAPALGEDYCSPNRDAADCTNNVECKVCFRIMERKLGHSVDEHATVDCGHAVKCDVCCVITQNSEGDHTFDWANARVIRAASEERPGLVMVTCTTCGREFERTQPSQAATGANVLAVGGGQASAEQTLLSGAQYGNVASDAQVGEEGSSTVTWIVALSVIAVAVALVSSVVYVKKTKKSDAE